MNASQQERYTVALQGFSPFERSTLASFFRLAAARTPAFVEIGAVERADFVVADADHKASLHALLAAGRTRDTVFVGAEPPHGAMAWLPRPVDPLLITRELDALVAQRRSSPDELGAALAAVTLAAVAPAPLDALPAAPASHSAAPKALDDSNAGADVLIADASAAERELLQQRLQARGFHVHVAADGDAALALLRSRRFDLVFLDIMLGPRGNSDGLRLCQIVKQSREFAGQRPRVVVVSAQAGALDRVRASLAGCDAFLAKPSSDDELRQTLHLLESAQLADEPAMRAA